MNRKAKKIISLSFLFFCFSVLIAGSLKLTFAASSYEDYLNNKDKLTAEGLHEHTLSDTVFGFLKNMAGTGEGSPEGTQSGKIKQEIGALQFTTNLIGAVYANPPASGVYYAYDVLHRLGAAPAYAQGVGFTGLQPILPIWKAFRNVTYVLFTLIFVGIGLAIMFRVKISPQAVITIENALPKIIGALILVTFSYAIAGFLIDLMYVLIALGITVLKTGGIEPVLFQLGPVKLGEVTPTRVINSGFFALLPMFFSVTNAGNGIFVLATALGGVVGTVIGTLIGGQFLIGAAIGLLAGPALIMLIWTVIALFLLFKLLFGLTKAYIKIIFAVIIGPLQIMMGAIPGFQAGGFGTWIKGIFAEILIFPAVVVVSMIGVFILQSANLESMWAAPLLDVTGSRSAFFIKTIIGMGFLLILAQIPDIIRNAMGIKDPGFGTAIGEAFGPVKTGAKYGLMGAAPSVRSAIARGKYGQRLGYEKKGSGSEVVTKGGPAKGIDVLYEALLRKLQGR